MPTNRIQQLGAVARLAALLVALAAAVTLTSVAAARPEAAKQRVAITQKVVVISPLLLRVTFVDAFAGWVRGFSALRGGFCAGWRGRSAHIL